MGPGGSAAGPRRAGRPTGGVVVTAHGSACARGRAVLAAGTGHGVGAFLNVHEGPHGMSLLRLVSDNSAAAAPPPPRLARLGLAWPRAALPAKASRVPTSTRAIVAPACTAWAPRRQPLLHARARPRRLRAVTATHTHTHVRARAHAHTRTCMRTLAHTHASAASAAHGMGRRRTKSRFVRG